MINSVGAKRGSFFAVDNKFQPYLCAIFAPRRPLFREQDARPLPGSTKVGTVLPRAILGALSNEVGTIVKLVRVLMLGPVVLGLSLLARDLRTTGVRTESRPDWQELVPWFITGFLFILIVRSLGLVPQVALPPITQIAATLTTIAMAALGLGVDIRVVAKSGVRVTLAVNGIANRARLNQLRAYPPRRHTVASRQELERARALLCTSSRATCSSSHSTFRH